MTPAQNETWTMTTSPQSTPGTKVDEISPGVESDECGSMNLFLAASPNAQVAHGALGCAVSVV